MAYVSPPDVRDKLEEVTRVKDALLADKNALVGEVKAKKVEIEQKVKEGEEKLKEKLGEAERKLQATVQETKSTIKKALEAKGQQTQEMLMGNRIFFAAITAAKMQEPLTTILTDWDIPALQN